MLTIGGTGNLNGDYWKETEKGWLARVPLQAAWLAKRRREDGLQWFGATELHAEHSAHAPLMEALGKDWGIGLGPGGNLLIYVKDQLEIVGTASDHYPQEPARLAGHSRWITKWNVRDPYHPETKFWLSIEHFRSGSTADIEEAKQHQAVEGNTFLDPIHRGIRMGDFNSWQTDIPTAPRGIMHAAGWRSLKHKTPKGRLVDGDLNTGLSWGRSGRWIEDMLTRDLVDVRSARLWDARPLTDHSAWLTATFDVHDKVLPV
jgi:hypothetical protein